MRVWYCAMSSCLLPYGHQSIDSDDIRAVIDILKSDYLTTGPAVEQFEAALAERCNARYAVVVSSGTAALHAAYFAAGLGPGRELITSPLTFAATASVAVHLGAKPVFADIDWRTLHIDWKEVKKRITARTKVIVPVDYAGEPVDLAPMRKEIAERDVVFISDACHSLGASLNGRPVGSLADMTVLSFHPVKNITTGEGGAVLTNSFEYAQRARDFRNHGLVRDSHRLPPDQGGWIYDITLFGFNYRLSDFQCALGKSQLRKLDQFLAKRRAIAQRYREKLQSEKRIRLPFSRADREHAWHLFPIRLEANAPSRRVVFDRLRAKGIGVQVHYIPVNSFQAFRSLGYLPEDTPLAWDAYQQLISLPLFPAMSNEDVDRVVKELQIALEG